MLVLTCRPGESILIDIPEELDARTPILAQFAGWEQSLDLLFAMSFIKPRSLHNGVLSILTFRFL